jgi:hypothetical protein
VGTPVAIVQVEHSVEEALGTALHLIGGVPQDVDAVTIKVGIFDARNRNYPSIPVLHALVNAFPAAASIVLVESDNYMGTALERLQVWHPVFSEHVSPFSLSTDPVTRPRRVCGERIKLSSVLFPPTFRVSVHALRKGHAGCVFKNLLGVIPDIKKDRFHKQLGPALIDIAEAMGWLDLAVIDATYLYSGAWKEGVPLDREQMNRLVVGTDPVAVETVGAILADEEPLTIPALAEAKKRGLGETDITKIHVVGEPIR